MKTLRILSLVLMVAVFGAVVTLIFTRAVEHIDAHPAGADTE